MATEKSAKTTTENEKLCMAVINNSQVTAIDWKGVANDLGIDKIPTVQKRWSRFKAAKFGSPDGSPLAAAASSTYTTPVKKGKSAGKKRGADEMNDNDNDKVARLTNKPRTPKKKLKMEIADAEMDEEDGGEIGHGMRENANQHDEHDDSQDFL